MSNTIRKNISLLVIYLIPLLGIAQNNDTIRNKIADYDLKGIIEYYNNNSHERLLIEDMIYGYINWNDYSYENVKMAYETCTVENSYLKDLLKSVVLEKEYQLYESFSDLSAEQLVLYCELFPDRKKLIDNYLNNIIYRIIHKMAYGELAYLNDDLKGFDTRFLSDSVSLRSNERKLFVREKIDDYAKVELKYRNRFLFILKYRTWRYFIVRYKAVAKEYSKIALVPTDANEMASQYNNIINAYFTNRNFKKQLQKDVDAYNIAINNVREEYANAAGLKGYIKSDIQIPDIGQFPIKSNIAIAEKISKARENHEFSKLGVNIIAGIASFVVGSFVSYVGKELYDINAAQNLAALETEIRKEYMKDVYNQLFKIFEGYYITIDKNVANQITNNNLKFKNYVKHQE